MTRSEFKNDTYNTKPSDYAEFTYWWSKMPGFLVTPVNRDKRQYVTDVNNPDGWSKPYTIQYVASEAGFYAPFMQDAHKNGAQVIDLTSGSGVIKVTRISKITERDYVLDLQVNDSFRKYQYVVQDCNHYNHAFNRFAKRVREFVNPKLGTNFTVVDAREKEEEPVLPVKPLQLERGQQKDVALWARDKGLTFSPGCACHICSKTYDMYKKAQAEQPVVQQPTVQDVIELVQAITEDVKQIEVAPIYTMHISINFAPYTEVCGDSNVLGLIRKAQEIVEAFDRATPNVQIMIRDRDNASVARITEEEGVTIF